jgi:hypothetical protein
MQDDDDKPDVPAPATVPADDKSADAAKPEDEKPEGETTETEAASDEGEVDEPEDDEDEGDDEGEEEGEGDENVPKRKASRAQRYKRQAERLKAENEALRSRPGGSLPSNEAQLARAIEQRVYDEIGPPPKQDDFKDANGNLDYIRFHDEQQAWLHERRAATREVKKEFLGALSREQARVGELVSTHKERVARFKTRVKDYDEVMVKATLPVAAHVERLILESKRSERISYHLAKNQAKLARLNNMSSEDVARELGRIEGRLSLPPPAKQTQARKPITPLRGGGTGPQTQTAARDAWLKKTYGDRA